MAVSVGGDTDRRGRWPALDGLRGVAILLVVFYHFHLPGNSLRHLQGGWAGVDVFFVLSGFLITTLLLQERFKTGGISWRGFYRRRWNRLGPALLAVVVAFEFVTLFARWPQQPEYGLFHRVVDLRTVFSLGANWWVIARTPCHPFLSTIWSLGIEEQFYLVWPVVILCVCRGRTPEAARRILLAVATAGTLLSATDARVLHQLGFGKTRIYFGTDTRSQGLFIGAAAAVIWLEGHRPRAWLSSALGLTGGLTIGAVAVVAGDTSGFQVGGAFTLLAASAGFVLLHVVWQPSDVLARLLSARVLRWVGRRSYALYLWHAGIATYLYSSGTRSDSRFGWAGYFGGIALALLLAELSWRLIESGRPQTLPTLIRRFARLAAPGGRTAEFMPLLDETV